MVSPDAIEAARGLLAGRRVLVIGSSGAIGAAIVAALSRSGADVVRADRVDEDIDIHVDVCCERSVRAAFDAAGAVTDVVNAAGTLSVGPLAAAALEEFQRVMDVNLKGAFLVGREAARRLPSGGSLTMLASQAGFRGAANWGLYCAAKAAVISLCETLARELGASRIRVNALCPGNVETPMSDEWMRRIADIEGISAATVRRRSLEATPLGRFADVGEIADVCVFLVSPLAAYTSGVALPVDGGEVSA